MVRKTRNRFLGVVFFFFSYCLLHTANCSAQVIDRVIAIVGNNPILQSELDSKIVQKKLDTTSKAPVSNCALLEELLFQKLLLTQAVKDSVEVTDEQVQDELERRLRYYISQFGSIEAFEKFYGKSVDKFKEEFKDELRDVLVVQKMQAKITEGITVSPAEVREFYQAIPKDSIPFINAEIEVGHIVRKPKVNPELKKYAKARLELIRQEIISGKKDFITEARLYSQDPGSALKGGLYEHVQRGTFVPEFDAVAFKMKVGDISEVFETEYGYHILQVEAKRGEEIDVRHILIIPEPSPEDLTKAKTFLDSIADLIKKDSISVTEAASRFSDDDETKSNGGLITNTITGTTKFEMSQLSQIDPNLFFTINNLKTGEPSAASSTQTRDGKPAYHIVYVKSRTEPHRENLKEDYQRIQDEALAQKKDKTVSQWIKKKVATNYVHLADDYKSCKFENQWILPTNQ